MKSRVNTWEKKSQKPARWRGGRLRSALVKDDGPNRKKSSNPLNAETGEVIGNIKPD